MIGRAAAQRHAAAAAGERSSTPRRCSRACVEHGTAVEINSRPERLDPPLRLLSLAVELGCEFAIDTDAHAPGQLDWQGNGCERAVESGVPVERVINTRPADDLLGLDRLSPPLRRPDDDNGAARGAGDAGGRISD